LNKCSISSPLSGLRSTKVGEQCEAIVRFPKLFEKYPFPILINSSFLKLAEFFRTGSNLLRLWVLRVCQQSEKHLEKILNVDEFVKRIFMVIHSNDPVARSLTLRTLGAVACVIPESEQVHHSIRRALDSHDTVEVEAAVFASVQFAEQSKTFAISMCSKIATMIESLQTPIGMKLKLIPVLRHMHHDANTASLVKTLGLNLLPKYPSESFVIVILDSLSQLSCATLVDIPQIAQLLIDYLQDPRKRVRYQVLKSLQTLAEKGAHLWPNGVLKKLIAVAMNCSDLGNEQSLVLSVVLTLTKCPAIDMRLLNEDQTAILELCSTCLVLEHPTAASQALGILTSLVSYCYTEKIPPPSAYLEQINLHLESLIYTSLMNERLRREFSQYLKCGVQLSEKNVAFAETFVELIGGLLTDDMVYPPSHSILLCETLGALCSQFCNKKYTPKAVDVVKMEVDDEAGDLNPFAALLPQLLRKLEKMADSYDQKQVHFIEILAAVCLQSMLGQIMPQKIVAVFEKILRVTNNWSHYRIARSASRYGHHYLAARIYQRLSGHVSLEKIHFFLVALGDIAKAECLLNFGYAYDTLAAHYGQLDANLTIEGTRKLTVIERLDKAISLYWKSLATFKASSSPTTPFTFQTEFVRLRAIFLEALYSVVVARNTQYITPPPAIAQTLAQNSRDPLQKFGHITNQLRKSLKAVKTSEDLYCKLYKSAFDADQCTLEYLEM
jgi:integrator complex subunit 7